ncbi:MAG: rRNA maturation RNase YbeY [Alphaproteobacteria bacterium]|nr:rRNA maturation RNase YbeY [Alphaproteobacteria bacterium]
MAGSISLDFQITVPSWTRLPRLRARLKEAAQATAQYLGSSLRAPASATILLSGNARIRQLNFDFRGMDRPTNVLSFPQFSPPEIARLAKKNDEIELGDIALAYQYVSREARDEEKKAIDHTTHLVIHGLLHLFGYDHQKESAAEKMEKAERTIMKSLGLPDPYATLRPSKRK